MILKYFLYNFDARLLFAEYFYNVTLLLLLKAAIIDIVI